MNSKDTQVLKLSKEQKQFMDEVLILCSTPGRGFPELTHAYLSVNIFSVEGDPEWTMACDSKWNVYINFDRFMNAPESHDTTVSAFTHEILHLMMDHFQRHSFIVSDSVVPHQVIRYAEELEINSSLFNNKHVYGRQGTDQFSLKTPLQGQIIVPGFGAFEKFPENKSMDQYIKLILEEMEKQKEKQKKEGKSDSSSSSSSISSGSSGNGQNDENNSSSGSNEDSGSGQESLDNSSSDSLDIGASSPCSGASDAGSNGESVMGSGESQSEGLSDIQIEAAKNQVASDIKEYKEKGIGSGISPEVLRWTDGIISGVKMPIGRVIKNFGSSVERTKIMATKRTYVRPNRRPGLDNRLVRPTRNSNKIRVATISDTSGSMSDGDGAVVKGAIADLMRRPDVEINGYTFDSRVHVQEKVRRIEDFKWAGGGGTDIRIPLKYLKDNHKELKTDYAIVLSDCGTPWPNRDEHFPFPVLIVGVDNGSWFVEPDMDRLPENFSFAKIELV